MGLKDALAANAVRKKGPICKVCLTLKAMSDEDRADLQAAMDDPVFAATGISRALKSEGYEVSDQMIQRHRRNDCRKQAQ